MRLVQQPSWAFFKIILWAINKSFSNYSSLSKPCWEHLQCLDRSGVGDGGERIQTVAFSISIIQAPAWLRLGSHSHQTHSLPCLNLMSIFNASKSRGIEIEAGRLPVSGICIRTIGGFNLNKQWGNMAGSLSSDCLDKIMLILWLKLLKGSNRKTQLGLLKNNVLIIMALCPTVILFVSQSQVTWSFNFLNIRYFAGLENCAVLNNWMTFIVLLAEKSYIGGDKNNWPERSLLQIILSPRASQGEYQSRNYILIPLFWQSFQFSFDIGLSLKECLTVWMA